MRGIEGWTYLHNKKPAIGSIVELGFFDMEGNFKEEGHAYHVSKDGFEYIEVGIPYQYLQDVDRHADLGYLWRPYKKPQATASFVDPEREVDANKYGWTFFRKELPPINVPIFISKNCFHREEDARGRKEFFMSRTGRFGTGRENELRFFSHEGYSWKLATRESPYVWTSFEEKLPNWDTVFKIAVRLKDGEASVLDGEFLSDKCYWHQASIPQIPCDLEDMVGRGWFWKVASWEDAR